MNARIESMSHGNGKVYLQMVLDRLHDDSMVLLDAHLKDGAKVPSHLFAFHPLDSASQANYVVVLPHFDVREVDLTFLEYSGQGAPLAQSRLTVELNLMSWRTYFNALVHNELMEQMFDIEREYSSDRMNIAFTDAITDGDECVVKMLVDMPYVPEADVMVDFLDTQGHEIDLPVYPLLDEVHDAQRVGERARLQLGFSVRVREATDFCVTVYDANDQMAGDFACFCEETYEPLHEAFSYYATDAARDERYEQWYRHHCETLAGLAQQRQVTFPYQPQVSLVLPLFAGDECYLGATLSALQQQTYEHFELVVVDAGLGEAEYQRAFATWEGDERLVHIEVEASLDEAAVRLTGLLQSSGEVCAILDPRVMLAPEALFECVRRINEVCKQAGAPEGELARDAKSADELRTWADTCGVIYAQHDFIDRERGLCKPVFKPVFSPDLLYSYNYCGPFVLFARSLINSISAGEGFATEGFEHDLLLKATARAQRVERIDQVLYHLQDPAAYSQAAVKAHARREEEAFRGGRKAVANHLRRMGAEAIVLSEVGERLYRVHYRLPDQPPSLAVVIFNKDHTALLDACLAALYESGEQLVREIVIVDNNSQDEQTQAYYDQIIQSDARIRVEPYAGIFNQAAMANVAMAKTSSEYVLFLDNDTEVITSEALSLLLAHCMRSDVGVVGAKLLFPDDTIQHAGFMVGSYGAAAAIGAHLPRSAQGYGKRLICASNVSAVSGSAMMVRRSVFNEVHGFDERFRMGCFDVDFCLKVHKAGYQVVFRGDVELYHHEHATAGHALSLEQRLRAEQERGYLHYRWPRIFVEGDSYFSACLNKEVPYFLLAPIQ